MKSRNAALFSVLVALVVVSAWHFNHHHQASLHRAGVLDSISKQGQGGLSFEAGSLQQASIAPAFVQSSMPMLPCEKLHGSCH